MNDENPIREKILYQTIQLFLTIGVKVVTMDDVASSMGISKKTLYHFFPTKKELVKETLYFFFDRIHSLVNQVIARKLDPIEEWITVIREVHMFIQLDDHASYSMQLKKYYREIFAEIHDKQWHLMEEYFYRNLEKGIEQGLFRSDFNKAFFCKMYYYIISNIDENPLFESLNYSIQQLKETLFEFQLRSITTPKGTKKLEALLTYENN